MALDFDAIDKEIEAEKKARQKKKPQPAQQQQPAAPQQEAPRELTNEEAMQRWIDMAMEAPGVIQRGWNANPLGMAGKTLMGGLLGNTYTAWKEDRDGFTGLPLAALMDLASFALSPAKALTLPAKMLRLKKLKEMEKIGKLVKPINKSPDVIQNTARNVIPETITGGLDNLIFEALGNAIDDREHDWKDYAAAGLIGAGMGMASAPRYSLSQSKGINKAAELSAPIGVKGHNKEDIRNAQNQTSSNAETFSKLVNEAPMFKTMEGLKQDATKRKEAMGKKMEEWEQTPEANAPLKNARLKNFKEKLDEVLDADNHTGLMLNEKQAIEEAMPHAIDQMMASNNEIWRHKLRETSQEAFGKEKEIFSKDKEVLRELLLGLHDFSPKEINNLRRSFDRRTTLTLRPDAVARAGEDNLAAHKYNNLFQHEIDTRPETDIISKYNKEWSKHSNAEELLETMQGKMGVLDQLEWLFPYMRMNPEINPTVLGNSALRQRNIGNQVGNTFKEYIRQPDKDKEAMKLYIKNIAEEARDMGIKTQEGINKHIMQRLNKDRPEMLNNKVLLGLMQTPEYQKALKDGEVEAK